MRYIPIQYLKEGMVLAKPIFNANGDVLLAQGAKIKLSYITRLSNLVRGIYVEDNLSEGIVIKDIISDKIKVDAVRRLKDIYEHPAKENSFQLNSCRLILENIIDEMLSNKNLMVNLIDIKTYDDYTFYHSVNVAILSIIIGSTLYFDRLKLYKLALGAMFHDIGKTFIPNEILNKPGKLTPDEFEIIKTHSFKGFDYSKNVLKLSTTSYMGILHHHEKWDGTGYPNNLKGDDISLFGQIISIADVYDAITSKRPYKDATLPSEAIELLMASSGSSFNPLLVKKFISKIAPYPVGLSVELSSGEQGIIMENFSDAPMRPLVKVVYVYDSPLEEPYLIDLRSDYSCLNKTIVKVINL